MGKVPVHFLHRDLFQLVEKAWQSSRPRAADCDILEKAVSLSREVSWTAMAEIEGSGTERADAGDAVPLGGGVGAEAGGARAEQVHHGVPHNEGVPLHVQADGARRMAGQLQNPASTPQGARLSPSRSSTVGVKGRNAWVWKL